MEPEGKRRGIRRPKDAIATLTPEERASIAELVDRNGAIYVATVGHEALRSLHPVVTVTSAERETLEGLATRINADITFDAPTPLRAHSMYRSQVFGERAVLLCQVLHPYLQKKAEQARLIATFPMGTGRPDDINAVNTRHRERVRDAVYTLNHPMRNAGTNSHKGDTPLPRSA